MEGPCDIQFPVDVSLERTPPRIGLGVTVLHSPGAEVGFPGALVAKNLPANAGDLRDTGSIPGSGRSPGGNPLQYCCRESPMDRGAWRATVHRVAENQLDSSDCPRT